MLWILLAATLVSADQVTQYKIDYGTYTVPATLTEDDSGHRIYVTSNSAEAPMYDVIVDYDTRQIILKSDRRHQCHVTSINDVIAQKVEEYSDQVHATKLVKALYYKFANAKPTGRTSPQEHVVEELCPQYHVEYIKLISADTVQPKTRGVCHGIGTGTWCIGVGEGLNVDFGWD